MSTRMALQLAERGYFVKELNVGWAEWLAEERPVHRERVPHGALKCSCSKW